VNDVKCIKEDRVLPFFSENEDLALSGKTSKETIDFLTRQIREIESVVEKKLKLKDNYKYLLTIPGVDRVLGLTIMLESGPISR
jgi:hypothetical protein